MYLDGRDARLLPIPTPTLSRTLILILVPILSYAGPHP